jgi:predicted nuclease with TOPRIM domain
MESRLRKRLDELRSEYDNGRKTLDELEGQAANVRATLLRIAGAVQVLEEMLGERQLTGESAMPPQAVENSQ